jgi:hypothetical protein
LTKFDISKNNLYAAGAKALVEGLKGNQVMTELDFAGNELGKAPAGLFGAKADMSGSIALADIIPGMGAILKITFSGDRRDSKPVTMESSMVEADFGGKGLGRSGTIMVAAFLPKCT